MATPLTELRLLNNVDLDTTYNNTFSSSKFGDVGGQQSFFSAKTVYSFFNLSFQRKERTIRIKKEYDLVEPLSYGMFKNGVNGKWYYFFVIDVLYVSENTTEIAIEIDVEQTYLFDVSYGDCFIEREHVASDNIGDNFVDENLTVNEIVTVGYTDVPALNDLTYVIATTVDSTDTDIYGDIYTGLYSGLGYYASDDVTFINNFITLLAGYGKLDAIKNIFVMPKNLINDLDADIRVQAPNPITLTITINKSLTTIDGYTPKNKKLFTYPYNYLMVSNHQGNDNIYKYEFFNDALTCGFDITCDVAPNPTVYLQPKEYKQLTVNNDEFMTLSNYPLCNWTGDVYSNWLAQNQVSNAVAVGGSALSLGVGIATGNPIAIGSGVLGVASTIGGFYEQSLKPNPNKGRQSGGGNIASNLQNFGLYQKCVTSQFAKIIDDFFTKYGYKVNLLKTPVTTSRLRHNYLKTQDTILKGNIPRKALRTLIDNREKGITFWHVDDIGNYSLDNDII